MRKTVKVKEEYGTLEQGKLFRTIFQTFLITSNEDTSL